MLDQLRIVIATRQRTQLLERTLSSLADARLPEGFRGVTVIENGGDADSEELVLRFKDSLAAEYLFHPVGNKSAALNVVLENLPDCLVVFTDDDVRFDRNILVAYSEAARNHPRGCFFGGPVEIDYEAEPPQWLKTYLPGSARGWSYSAEESNGDAPLFIGMNWAAYAEDIKSVGLFETSVGPGATTHAVGQETEMQIRLRKAGGKPVYVPDAKVWHYVPAERCSPEWTLKREYRHSVSYGMLHDAYRPSVAGYPLGELRNLVLNGLRMLPAQCSRDQQSRFAAKHRLIGTFGYLRGRRIAWSSRRGR